MIVALQDPDIPTQAGANVGNITELHELGVAALLALAVLAVLLPRRWSALPLVALLCFIPAGQRVVLLTLDFTFLRLLMLVLWLRLVVRRELRPLVWNHLDRALLLWAASVVVTGTILSGTVEGFVNRAGTAVDALSIYFFFRLLLRSQADLMRVVEQFALLGIPVLLFFLIENNTQRNMFHVFGGVPEITDVRDGRLRCQGAFAHPILAGCFWAALIPFYFVRGWLGRGWVLPLAGIASALAIVVLSASSTPVMSVAFGVAAGACFLVRGALRWYRWMAVGTLFLLHLLMNMPVWHLLARVDLVGGSTGWHRFHLMDQFFGRFGEWWLVGTPYTGHWGIGLEDVTNMYVAEGVTGGMTRLVAFLLLPLFAFWGVSRSLRVPGLSPNARYAAWALGTALFMHCMNFIAVSYFEQIVVLWYMALGATASLALVPGGRPAARRAIG